MNNFSSRLIHGEEVDEIERVKRDVNVETVETDIRYFFVYFLNMTQMSYKKLTETKNRTKKLNAF